MVVRIPQTLAALYEADETAWLEATADLVRNGLLDQVDLKSLAEYLTDMARRDRREVESRLTVLLAHVLKWIQQPDRRSRSWRATVVEQRQELSGLVGRGVLLLHAQALLPEANLKAVERAAAETGLPDSAFPENCPYTLDELLTTDLLSAADADP